MATEARRGRPGDGLPSELADLLRGLSGGFVFALPVIYTMEVWWLGYDTPTWKVLLFLALGYGFVVLLNRVSGFKCDHAWPALFKDGVEAIGMSLVVSVLMLTLMGALNPNVSLVVALRMVLVLAIPVAIGVSLSRSQLAGNGDQSDSDVKPKGDGSLNADMKDIGLTIVGGIFLGLSVAPTEEILMIATQGSWLHWLGMMALSIFASYVMIFTAHFTGQMGRLESEGLFQKPWVETIVTYAVSLLVALGLLAFLGFVSGGVSPVQLLIMTVTLGLPTTLGGAAARLLL